MSSLRIRLAAPLGALCVALGLSACGGTSPTSEFTGAAHQAAEAIASFQSDATVGNAKKICESDLAKATIKRIEANGGTCVKAIKSQLGEVDSFNLTVQSISVKGKTATAKVKSVWSGKLRPGTLSLLKEERGWKVSDLGSPS